MSGQHLSERATIAVATDFSRFPAGRYRKDGPFSGEQFRQDLLAPALKKNFRVVLKLDGTEGYGSSFLEEAFGGLIREEGFRKEEILNKLDLISDDDYLKAEILDYIDDAARVKRKTD